MSGFAAGRVAAVHVYYADRRTLRDEFVAALVTEDDRRLTSAMVPRRRAEYLAGRALLRHALECYTRRAGASFRFAIAADGKPECVDGPAISVSHSGDLVVCAVSAEGTIGVDVEASRPGTSLVAVAERYFTAEEARWVAADPEQRFPLLWVLKEAYLKALGVGLAGGLRALECRIEPPAIAARVASGAAAPQLALWTGRGCHVGLAVAGARRLLAVEVSRWAHGDGPDAFGPWVAVAVTA